MNVRIVAIWMSLLVLGLGAPGYAQQAPMLAAAAPSVADAAAAQAMMKSLLDHLDPCAGPLELQAKTSITPCVYVAGEASVSYGYTSVNIPVSLHSSGIINGSRTFTTFGHLDALPAFTVSVGVSRNAQITVVAPSSIDTNSQSSAASGGVTDTQFSYKQLVYKNLRSQTLASLELLYEAPTGGPPFGAAGPSYTGQFILGQALPAHFGAALELPVSYGIVATNAAGGNTYGLTFAPVFVPYWQSPGGTLVALVASHSFNPDSTPLAISALQLVSRYVHVPEALVKMEQMAAQSKAAQK